MTEEDGFDLSRRKIIGSAATLGAAGALGGAGTGALLWDEEKFGNLSDPNVLEGGELDLKVDWEVRYYDWIDTTDQLISQNELTDQPGPIVNLTDVKPGDVLEATLSAHVFGNPGFLGFHYQEHADTDNGITEPEDKVNGHEPDNSDGDPFLNGGIAALLAGAVPESLFSQSAETDDDGSKPRRKDLMRTLGAAGAAAGGTAAFSGSAAAAPGDLITENDLPGNPGSVGFTFTGQYLITTEGLGSTVLQVYEPAAGGMGAATLLAEKDIVDGGGNPITLSGVEWDPSRGQLWGAHGDNVYLVDIGDPTSGAVDAVADHQFSPSDAGVSANRSLIDGLALDSRNDTLWWSYDVSEFIWHFDLPDGSLIDTLHPEYNDAGDRTEDGFNGISGLAVGADIGGRPTIYFGKPNEEEIIRSYSDDGGFIVNFANPQFRVEDLTCDPVTYDTEAILTKASGQGVYQAIEVEEGTCPIGGGGEPEGDGELDDVMQCVVWYDDGDNIPGEIWEGETDLSDAEGQGSFDGLGSTQEDYVMEVGEAQSPSDIVDTDAAIFTGTLDDMDGADVMFNAQNSVAGSVATDFPDSWCYQNSVTEYIGFLCWVPRDIPGVNDNVIQTDRLEFQFGFDAIQCRHNVANDGGPFNGTIDEADADNNANTP